VKRREALPSLESINSSGDDLPAASFQNSVSAEPDLNGRRMRVMSTDTNGVVSSDTILVFEQTGNVVSARYRGGSISTAILSACANPPHSGSGTFRSMNAETSTPVYRPEQSSSSPTAGYALSNSSNGSHAPKPKRTSSKKYCRNRTSHLSGFAIADVCYFVLARSAGGRVPLSPPAYLATPL